MNKIRIGVLFVIAILAVSGIAIAQGNSQRFLVKSHNAALKAMFGVQHNFEGGFTTELTKGQLKALEMLGVGTEEIPLYHITAVVCGDGKCHPRFENADSCPEDCSVSEPICGDGVCEGDETPETCPEDCSTEPEPGRTCEPSTQLPWGIEMVNGGSGGAGVNVAVLDSGVYTDHLDLARRIADCKDFTKRGIREGCADKDGHGTHVAGTILADGGEDNQGIYGVAPEAELMAIKVCGPAGCWTDDIAAGIRYAADNGANIISMSFGGPSQSGLIKDAIDENPDVLFVASAGNSGPGEDTIGYPGAYVKVIAVGAIDVNEDVPYWSSRGINPGETEYFIEEREVEFGAPGVAVESTFKDGCYITWQGTSMAAPHVSGLAAKLWDIADGTLDGIGNAADTRNYLQSIAKDIWTTGDDTATGFGLPIAP